MTKRLAWLFAARVLCAAGPADARDHACSDTSTAALTACKADAEDEYWTAFGVCTNVSTTPARRQCLGDAKSARTEKQQECADQFEARDDLCDALGEAPYDPQIKPPKVL